MDRRNTNNLFERRVIQLPVELRQDAEGGIQGYGLTWAERADVNGLFTESFERGAFADTLKDDDQVLMVQHSSLPIARKSRSTLELSEDDKGLRFIADLDARDTTASDSLVKIERGDLQGVSIGFTIYDGGEESWEHNEEGLDHRTIHKVGTLMELSLVTFPVYDTSEVAQRALDVLKIHRNLAAQNIKLRGKMKMRHASRLIPL